MDIKIVHRHKNPVLHREEIRFEVKSEKATPARKVIAEKIAAECGSKPELTVLEKIGKSFGSSNVSGTALVYADKEQMEISERDYLSKRTAGKKKKEAEEKPVEKKEEAKPTEEKKPEEKPAEKKEAPKEEKQAEKPAEKKEEPKEEKK